MTDPMYCPRCDKAKPPGAQVCVCGYRFDRAARSRVDTEGEDANPVRITEIKLTFSNALGITAQFWFASLLCSLVVGAVGLVVYVVVSFVQTYS